MMIVHIVMIKKTDNHYKYKLMANIVIMATYYRLDLTAETTIQVDGSKIPYRVKRNKYVLFGQLSTMSWENVRKTLIEKLNETADFKLLTMHPQYITSEIFNFYRNNIVHITVDNGHILAKCNIKGEFLMNI
jgi:hypothetical protein